MELTTDGEEEDGVSAASGMLKSCGACCLKSILLLMIRSFRPFLKVKAMKATVLCIGAWSFILRTRVYALYRFDKREKGGQTSISPH